MTQYEAILLSEMASDLSEKLNINFGLAMFIELETINKTRFEFIKRMLSYIQDKYNSDETLDGLCEKLEVMNLEDLDKEMDRSIKRIKDNLNKPIDMTHIIHKANIFKSNMMDTISEKLEELLPEGCELVFNEPVGDNVQTRIHRLTTSKEEGVLVHYSFSKARLSSLSISELYRISMRLHNADYTINTNN